MRLTVPCRAVTCSHLQCFDAALYLQMNEKKPTWICPVCDKKATYESLIIDGWDYFHCSWGAILNHNPWIFFAFIEIVNMHVINWALYLSGSSWKYSMTAQMLMKSSFRRMGLGVQWDQRRRRWKCHLHVSQKLIVRFITVYKCVSFISVCQVLIDC